MQPLTASTICSMPRVASMFFPGSPPTPRGLPPLRPRAMDASPPRRILMSPQGAKLTQSMVESLARAVELARAAALCGTFTHPSPVHEYAPREIKQAVEKSGYRDPSPKDYKALKAIEKMLKQEIPWVDGAHSEAEQAETSEAGSNGNGRRRGGRP